MEYMDRMFGYFEQQSGALFGREIPQTLLIHANRLNSVVIDELLTMISARGYRFVELDAALADSAYASPNTWTGNIVITWLHRWARAAGKGGDFFAGEPELPTFIHDAFAETDRP